MANLLETLVTTARLVVRGLGRPARTVPGPDVGAFRHDFAASAQGLGAKGVQLIDLPSDQPPWFDTGLDVTAGDHLTMLNAGRTVLSGLLDLFVASSFQVWYRVGTDGPIFRGTRATHSVTAEQTGRLYIAPNFPGEWATPDGGLSPNSPPEGYKGMKGDLTVGLINWGATDGLAQWAASGVMAELKQAELARRADPYQPPEGWQYLWYLGDAEIFRKSEAGGMCCHTAQDVAILQKEVSLPFTQTTRIDWKWLIDQLPATIREDTLPTHDYLSVAVEFDDGQDLTYHWSAELPKERIYECPLPTWADKETHLVVRSGPDGLGAWQDESRDLYDDYRRAIAEPRGIPMPTRIVKVWLIAVSIFQRGEGRCEYRDIIIRDGDQETRVL